MSAFFAPSYSTDETSPFFSISSPLPTLGSTLVAPGWFSVAADAGAVAAGVAEESAVSYAIVPLGCVFGSTW